MITIDARVDSYIAYNENTTRGAIAKYIVDLELGEGVPVSAIIDINGKSLGASDIRNHVGAIAEQFGCKFRTASFNNFIVISKISPVTKNKIKGRDISRISSINAATDVHPDYREGTLRGAIAKHVLKMKEGESVYFKSVKNKKGVEQDSRQVRSHLTNISQNHKAVYTCYCDSRRGGMVITMLAQPKRVIRLKAHCRKMPKTKKEVSNDTANMFLTGRIGHEPRTA